MVIRMKTKKNKKVKVEQQLQQIAHFCSSIVVKIYVIKVSQREKMKITVNIKVIKWHNENLLALFTCLYKSYVVVKFFQYSTLKN